MANEFWDPGSLSVDRQPPDEEEFGFDTADRRDERWLYAVPDDAAEWLSDAEAGATDSDDRLDDGGPPVTEDGYESGFRALPMAALVAATLSAVAILIAVLRRRG